VQLKDLKTDKTITYIKNIRMFDLSGSLIVPSS